MIENTDVGTVDTDYFDIISARDYTIVLRSKCTGHYWHLLEQQANGHRTFSICHRHNPVDSYHPQTNRPSIAECCRYIIDHDAYHIERVRKQKERRLRRLGLIEGEDPQDRSRKKRRRERRFLQTESGER